MSLYDLHLTHPELYEQLEQIADQRSIPFCYMCYIDAPTGRCVRCGSDDLMRHLPGVGVEYGYEWVIESLLRDEVDHLTEEYQEDLFSDYISACYEDDIQIGFIMVRTAWAIKQLDPIAFDMAKNEYFSEEDHVEINCRLYGIDRLEKWVEEQIGEIDEDTDKEGVSA